jgi:acetyl-CoA carboxylase biotin carboxyl carrier protein
MAEGSSPPERAEKAEGVGTRELIELIDRFEALLVASDVTELEVQVGDVALLLRKPEAIDPSASVASTATSEARHEPEPESVVREEPPTGLHAILAPLTGIFYTSPAPGAAAYVTVGGEVNKGQVIGLIEAMKLFNEIKSDVTGRVARFAADGGTLVKAKQPLIEVELA